MIFSNISSLSRSSPHSTHGDISLPIQKASNPVLCAFAIDDPSSSMIVGKSYAYRRMNVGVGEDGIIGRMISVWEGGKRVGRGVVGWG